MDRSKKYDIYVPPYQSTKHVFSASYRPSSLLGSFGMNRTQYCPYSQEAQSLAVEAFSQLNMMRAMKEVSLTLKGHHRKWWMVTRETVEEAKVAFEGDLI